MASCFFVVWYSITHALTHPGSTLVSRGTPNDAHQEDGAGGEEEGEEEMVGIPQEFLGRVSSASTTDYSSQSSEEYALGEGERPGSPSRPTSAPLPPPPSSLPHVRPSGDGHESEPIRRAQPIVSRPSLADSSPANAHTPSQPAVRSSLGIPVNLSVASIGAEVTIPAHGQPPSGSRYSRPLDVQESQDERDRQGSAHSDGEALPMMYQGTHSEMEKLISQLLGWKGAEGLLQQPGMEGEEEEVGAGDATLIADELEPSLMREADEFSRFEPTHLASMLNRDSLLRSVRPPVTAGQDSTSGHPSPKASILPNSSSLKQTDDNGGGKLKSMRTRIPPEHVVGDRLSGFAASVDRYGVLHGNVKLAEQVRPVADGFTERDVLQLSNQSSVASLAGTPASTTGLTSDMGASDPPRHTCRCILPVHSDGQYGSLSAARPPQSGTAWWHC